VLGAFSGCGNGTADSVAVRKASERLIAASGNGAAGIDAEQRSSAFAAVISEIQKVESSSKNPGIKASAALLSARAMIGQGEIAAEKSRDHRIAALLEIARLRSRLMLQEDTVSLTGALSVYDPSADLAAIDSVARAIGVEADALRVRVRDVDAQIAEVRGQIGERMERSRRLREQDSTIRLATADMGATQRADAITRATTIRREADALEMQASELELKAASLETAKTELQGVSASLQERSRALADARARVQESATLVASEAKSAEGRASEFKAEIVEGFRALQDGPLAEMLAASEEGLAKFNSAAAKASGARATDAVNSALTTAAASQAAADLNRNIAQTLSLAGALAQAMGDSAAATELNAKRDEANLAAGEALGRAASAFQGVRVSRDQATSDALAKLTESLERDGRKLRGEPEPAPEPTEEPAAEDTGAESAPDAEPTPAEEAPQEEPADAPATDEPATDVPATDEPAPDAPPAGEPDPEAPTFR